MHPVKERGKTVRGTKGNLHPFVFSSSASPTLLLLRWQILLDIDRTCHPSRFLFPFVVSTGKGKLFFFFSKLFSRSSFILERSWWWQIREYREQFKEANLESSSRTINGIRLRTYTHNYLKYPSGVCARRDLEEIKMQQLEPEGFVRELKSSLNNCAFLGGDKTGHRNEEEEEEEEEKSALITGIVFNRADYSPTFC